VIVFANTITHRLKYIADFIGQQIIGKSFDITDSQDKFIGSVGAKINYSNQPIAPDEFWIKPAPLLFETDIHPQQID